MLQLLQKYSISDILIFIVMLAIAIKGIFTFFDTIGAKIKLAFNKKYNELTKQSQLVQRLEKTDKTLISLKNQHNYYDNALEKIKEKIDTLIESDKDDIKAYITREHHYFCYQKGWIDDFSLDCIEHRYNHYEKEGGNSFIAHFMDQLRALPKQQPQQ